MGARARQLKGRIEQAAGSLTGNKKLEREGRIDRRSGETVKRLHEATDKVEEVIDKAADAMKGAAGIGEHPRRRKHS